MASDTTSGPRHRLRTAGIVLLVVVVVGLAAGSIADTTVVEDSGGGAGFMSGGQPSSPGSAAPADDPSPIIGFLLAGLVVLFVVGVLSNPREFARRLLALGAAAGVLAVLLYVVVLSTDPTAADDPGQAGRDLLQSGQRAAAQPGLGTGPESTSPALLLFVGVVVLLLFGLLAALTRGGSGRLTPGGEDPGVEEDDPLARVAASAGRAADRLEDAEVDLDNEVYRAWNEMTTHLDVDNRGARTPREFRRAALAEGMARTDVEALTELFEDVRYGGAAPTSDRERDAVAALRRIEQAYADGGAPT